MCYSPRLAVRTGIINPKTGKEGIRFLGARLGVFDFDYEGFKKRYGDKLVLIPCGSCPSCLKQYSFSWSTRLMAESIYHDQKCFLTLTYDKKHLPKSIRRVFDTGEIKRFHPLVKKDLQDFFKRLRRSFPDVKIRYFACGEHGDQIDELGWLGRPHYHVILFGLDFEDKRIISWNELGQPLYTSDKLASIWKNGLVSIGEVTAESCGYVARYSLKKRVTKEKTDEFVLMSRKPCIGRKYYEDHKHEIYLSDKLYSTRFGSVGVPRAFDKLAENDENDLVNYFYQLSKDARLRRAKGKEYQNVIAFGLSRVEDAQDFMFSRTEESMKRLRRNLC